MGQVLQFCGCLRLIPTYRAVPLPSYYDVVLLAFRLGTAESFVKICMLAGSSRRFKDRLGRSVGRPQSPFIFYASRAPSRMCRAVALRNHFQSGS